MRKLAAVLLFAFTLLAPAHLAAQTGSLSGRVTDAETGNPLSGVQVDAVRVGGATAASVITDADGVYRFPALPAGSYRIVLRSVGYEELTSDPVQLSADSRTMAFALRSRAVALNPVVVSASRQKEKALDAPATVSVVSQEAVEERPALTPVEHVRSLPGVDIITQGIQATNVVARGFNNIFSTTLHTLTDYRIASIPSLRVNLMHFVPANNEDIERIELVLGPGSALYGPNTSSGVLHILTRSPLDHQGTAFSIAGGERSVFQGQFRTAHLLSPNFGVKVSGQYMRGNEWEYTDPVEFAARAQALTLDPNTKIGLRDYKTWRWGAEARADWRVTPATTAVLQGGYTLAGNGVELTGIGAGQTVDWSYSYVQARVSHDRLFAQAYVNMSDAGDTYLIRNGLAINDDSRVFVGQLQHGFNLGPRQSFTYGADAIRTLPDTHGTIHGRNEADDDLTEAGAYVQSETKLTSRLNLVLAGRVDHHSRLEKKAIFSPRAALVFNPRENQSFRVTFNRAFSTPVSFNLFLDLDAGPVPGAAGDVLGYRVRAMGTEPTGFRFQNPDGSLVGISSPFAAAVGRQPGEMLTADTRTLWLLGIGALQSLGRIDANTAAQLRQINPTSSQIATMILNPSTQAVTPLATTDILDVPRIRESQNSTFEVGYKGILGDRLLLSLDAWYERRSNFTSPLTPFSPFVRLDSAGIFNVTFAAFQQAGMPQAQARAQAQALAAGMSGIPVGVATSPEVSARNASYLIATYRNFGEISLWGTDVSASAILNDLLTLTLGASTISKDYFVRLTYPVGLNAPKLKATGSLNFHTRDRAANAEVRARYTAEFPVISAPYSATACIEEQTPQALPGFQEPCIPAATIFDVNAGYRLPIFGKPQIQLSVTNVFDKGYRSFVGVPEIGRMALLRLRYEF